MSEPAFDWSQAASLLGEDPNQVSEDMAAIVLELVESSTERLQELKAMNAETELPAIRSLAHQLRGSLLNFGFTAVGLVLLDIEKKEYPAAAFPGMADEAIAVFGTSKQLLGKRYPTLKIA